MARWLTPSGPLVAQGLGVAAAGVLVVAEDEKYTRFLNLEDFESVVRARAETRPADLATDAPSRPWLPPSQVKDAGGEYHSTIKGTTDLVVMGCTDKLNTKNNPDTWTGSGKHAAIEKQRANPKRTVPLRVISLSEFMNEFNLAAAVRNSVSIARWEPGSKSYKSPGKARNTGSLFGATLQYNDGSKLRGMNAC